MSPFNPSINMFLSDKTGVRGPLVILGFILGLGFNVSVSIHYLKVWTDKL